MSVTIGVSGAAGEVGRRVAEGLLARDGAPRLVLTTRSPAALDDLRARGAEVRSADFDAPEGLAAAFAGIDRLLLISASTVKGDRIAQHGAAIDAARQAGVSHITFTSMPRVEDPDHPVGVVAHEYLGTERLLAASGVPWTVLRNGPYMELNLVDRLADFVVDGAITNNMGAGGMGFVSRDDCATAACAVLTGNRRHDARIYEITGPAVLGYAEVAAQVSEVLGRPVSYRAIDDEAMGAHLRAGGASDEVATALVGLGRAVREGYFARRGPDLETLTGSRGRPVIDVLRQQRDALEQIFAVRP